LNPVPWALDPGPRALNPAQNFQEGRSTSGSPGRCERGAEKADTQAGEAARVSGGGANPRRALRRGISKVNFHKVYQLLTIFPLKNEQMAPRTNTGYPHEGASVAGGWCVQREGGDQSRGVRSRANVANVRQSRPDFGVCFQVSERPPRGLDPVR